MKANRRNYNSDNLSKSNLALSNFNLMLQVQCSKKALKEIVQQ